MPGLYFTESLNIRGLPVLMLSSGWQVQGTTRITGGFGFSHPHSRVITAKMAARKKITINRVAKNFMVWFYMLWGTGPSPGATPPFAFAPDSSRHGPVQPVPLRKEGKEWQYRRRDKTA